MSNSPLEQARELLKARRFDEARALLQSMPNDPTAQKWLAKLNEMYPEQLTASQTPEPVVAPLPQPEPVTSATIAPPDLSAGNIKLEAARQLIQEKRYTEARMLLKTVNDPVAWTWLAKLDQIAPEPKAAEPPRRKPDKFVLGAMAVLAVLVVMIFAVLVGQMGRVPTAAAVIPSNTAPIPTMMVLPTETQTPSPTSGPSELELTSTAVISANATIEAHLLMTQTRFAELNEESLTAEAKQVTLSTPSPTAALINGEWIDTGDGSIYQDVGHWVVSQTVDAFTDERSYMIFTDSEDMFQGWLDEFYATLVIGCFNNGLQVAVNIDTQFDIEYGAGDYITARLRFDSGESSLAAMRELESGDMAIFENPPQMLRQLLAHDTLLFGFNVYNAGQAAVTFDLSGLQEALDASEQPCFRG